MKTQNYQNFWDAVKTAFRVKLRALNVYIKKEVVK